MIEKVGIVKHLVSDKGFGFIELEGYERDVFFHMSQFDGDFKSLNDRKTDDDGNVVQEGDRLFVTEVEKTPKGFVALGLSYE